MKASMMALALWLLFGVVEARTDDSSFYAPTNGISCGSVKDMGAVHSVRSCAFLCTTVDETCSGFGYETSMSQCKLCIYAGPTPQNAVTISSRSAQYKFKINPQKDILVHVPMDSIVNNTIPSLGTEADTFGRPGPTTTVGKYGNAISTPNSEGAGDITIRLGSHENDCLGNVALLCPDGATFSLWFKPSQLSGGDITLFASSSMSAIYDPDDDEFDLTIHLNNGSHNFEFAFPERNWDRWYFLGFTYSKTSGFIVYFDSCTPKFPNKILPQNITIRNFELGCVGQLNCPRAYFDDLRLWPVKKSQLFLCELWQM